MKKLSFFATVMMLAALPFSFAQSPAPPKPADPPAKKLTLVTSELGPQAIALYAAIHKRDQAAQELTDLNLRLAQLQNQAAQQYQQLQTKKQQADAAVDAARAEAYKAAKLDQSKYDLSEETMEFTAKPEPPKEAKK